MTAVQAAVPAVWASALHWCYVIVRAAVVVSQLASASAPCSCASPQYLRSVSEGVVAYLLDMADAQRPVARVVCRELLAAAVLRPLLMWATPYYANKALYAALRERASQVRLHWGTS